MGKKRKLKLIKPVIEVCKLSIKFDRLVLRKLSWKIKKGEQWVLLGSNGSGKTTLLMAIAGYIPPTRGEILIGDEGVSWTDLRKDVCIVSASIAQRIDPAESAFDVVLSGKDAMINRWGPVSREDRKKTHKVLRKTEVDHLASRRWGVLSQGERQRVLVGRALMGKCRVLILDEPCAGLDPVAREEFLEFIERLATRQRGAPTIIFVTHHVEEIMPCFTHAALLAEGELIAAGPLDEVMKTSKLRSTFGEWVKLRKSGGRYRLKVEW